MTMHKKGVYICEAHVRFNPVGEPAAIIQGNVDGSGKPLDTTIGGVLGIHGWTRETAVIDGCHLEHDESLAPGTIVITPLASDNNQEGGS